MFISSDSEGNQSSSSGVAVMDVSAVVDERRSCRRSRRDVTMNLRTMGRSDVHCCSARDISEGGLYVCVPVEYGLTVGRRVEVAFADDGESPSFAGESYYATVVRTTRLADAAEDLIGAGLRFDRPLFFDLVTALDEPHS